VVIGPTAISSERHVIDAASEVAAELDGEVCVLTAGEDDVPTLDGKVNRVIAIQGVSLADDVAPVLISWARSTKPWAVFASSTLWGRELLGRLAVDLDAGLVGDALGVEAVDGRLVCWKPAFNGRVEAAITATSEVQLVTLRPSARTGETHGPQGRCPRAHTLRETVPATPRGRVSRLGFIHNGDVSRLLTARVVIGVGRGVQPEDYPLVERLRAALGAELCATRRVTDAGWLPRQTQVGLTGHSIAPDLYLGLGMSGRFNHLVGLSRAKRVVLVTLEPAQSAEVGVDLLIRSDWRKVVQHLLAQLPTSPSPSRPPVSEKSPPEFGERSDMEVHTT
jgi:electron transfer flavoprotein alpha subunit